MAGSDDTVIRAILRFFNRVETAEEIVREIPDDSEHGSGSARAYGVRSDVAQRVLDTRNELPDRKFENLEQIFNVPGIGPDTQHDIIAHFTKSPEAERTSVIMPVPEETEDEPPVERPEGREPAPRRRKGAPAASPPPVTADLAPPVAVPPPAGPGPGAPSDERPAGSDDGVDRDILEFFNRVESAEEIVQEIPDDRQHGSGSARAYGIRTDVAQRVLDARKGVGGKFQSVAQIFGVPGIGPDTQHDIIAHFTKSKESKGGGGKGDEPVPPPEPQPTRAHPGWDALTKTLIPAALALALGFMIGRMARPDTGDGGAGERGVSPVDTTLVGRDAGDRPLGTDPTGPGDLTVILPRLDLALARRESVLIQRDSALIRLLTVPSEPLAGGDSLSTSIAFLLPRLDSAFARRDSILAGRDSVMRDLLLALSVIGGDGPGGGVRPSQRLEQVAQLNHHIEITGPDAAGLIRAVCTMEDVTVADAQKQTESIGR